MSHADSYFYIGHTHSVCQDYAAHSEREPAAYLSDGCSGAPMTDWGARILVQNALVYGSGDTMLHVSEAQVAALRIPEESLSATLGFVKLVDWRAEFGLQGDGYVIQKYRNGAMSVLHIEWLGDMPLYPIYRIRNIDTRHLTCELHRLHGRSTPTGNRAADFDMIVVCSDGLGTFVDTENRMKPVDVVDLAADICGVKVPTGAFLQRRIKALKRRKWKSYRHNDDFSAIGLWLGDVQ